MTALSFDILGRDKASQAFDKVGRAADRTEKKFGFLAARSHGLTAGMTVGFGKIAGALGALAGISAFKGFIDEARESRRVGALTEAAIKSTGGAAKITASQVGDLATAISNKTGADDEAVQSGANLLLTFTNIRNQAGKNNDIFNQATQTVTDMAAALNGGAVSQENIKSSSIQLGKALNDPIKGVTALQKVGVSFTQSQKDQIKTLVDSGDTLSAQKIILGELKKEFGGAAAAAADPLQRLSVIAGNAKEAIGTALLPVVDKAATWLGEVLPPAADVTTKFFNTKLLPAFKSVGTVITKDVLPYAPKVVDVFKGLGSKLADAIGPVDIAGIGKKILDDAVGWAKDLINGFKSGIQDGDWKPLGTAISDGISLALTTISENGGKILDAFGSLIDKIDWGKLGGKINGAVRGLIAGVDWKSLGSTLGDGVVNLFQKATDLGDKIGKAFKAVINRIDWRQIGRDSTNAVIAFVQGVDWVQVGKVLGVSVFKSLKLSEQIKGAVIGSAADLVLGIFDVITQKIEEGRKWVVQKTGELGGWLWAGLKSGIVAGAKGIGNWLRGSFVDPVVNAVKSLFGIQSPSTVFAAIGAQIIAGFKSGLAAAARGIGSWMARTVIAPALAPFAKAGTWLTQHGRNLVSGFKNGVAAIGRTVGSWMNTYVIQPAVRGFTKAGSWLVQAGRNVISGFWNGLGARWTDVGKWIGQRKASVLAWIGSSVGWLYQRGRDVISGFWTGLGDRWKDVTKWVGGIATWIKEHKGPVSLDARLLIPAGRAIMSGFLTGLQSGAGKAWDFVSRVGGKTKEAVASAYGWIKGLGWPDALGGSTASLKGFGGGVARWAKVALKALQITGSPASWLGSLLRRMNQESGGNPRAINLWDSNAKKGTPSMGLMQTILPTFNAYAGAYRKYGPWDPLANIIASINYANARYGSAPRGWDRPGGYKQGGWLMPGQLAWNETRKPEAILNQSQWNKLADPRRGRGGGDEYHFHLDGAIIANEQQALDWLTRSMDKLKRQGRV